MGSWRAGCGGSRMSGSGDGPGRPTVGDSGTASRSDPTTPPSSSTSAAGASNKSSSATGAARATPSSRPVACLPRHTERLDERGKEKLTRLLEAGDPNGQVRMAWLAKESVRELYSHSDADLALTFVDELVRDMTDKDMPPEVRSLGRTLKRWRLQIAAWHSADVSNGPTEAVNNLIKRVKRGAFGFTNFANYRIRSLLYAGKPNWSRLGVVSPPVSYTHLRAHETVLDLVCRLLL